MELLVIGKIGGTHHLKGAVKVHSSLGEVLHKIQGNKVMIELADGELEIVTVKSVAPLVGDRWIIDFEEIKNKTEAAKYTKCFIKVRRDLIGIEEDEYLINDLLEMNVLDENSKFLGKVVNIFDTAAHEILEIESETEEGMIPNIPEFVQEIDFDKKEIRVILYEGMLEPKRVVEKKVDPRKVIRENLEKNKKAEQE